MSDIVLDLSYPRLVMEHRSLSAAVLTAGCGNPEPGQLVVLCNVGVYSGRPVDIVLPRGS